MHSRAPLALRLYGVVTPFCFPPKLTLGLNCSKKKISESSDFGIPEVGKFKNNLKLSRPRFNFGAKQKSKLQNFVLEGHPNVLTAVVHN